MSDAGRWAWAEVDLDALTHNVSLMREAVTPAEVWAVVKADGYGHGVAAVAGTALAAGATGLCVALVQEGIELRRAGLTAPIHVLSQQPAEQADEIIAADLTPTVYTADGIDALAAAARRAGRTVGVQLKVDSGMHRVGARPEQAAALIDRIRVPGGGLRLDGLFTHLAMADEPGDPTTGQQIGRFEDLRAALGPTLDGVAVHVVNSAGAMAFPAARHDRIRLGIAMYGIVPGPGLLTDPASAAARLCRELRPALSLRARVGHVKSVAAGSGVSYGHRYRAPTSRLIATVPLGYADGVPRRLFAAGGQALLGGRRVPIAGVVTMDQLMLDCGPADDPDVAAEVGDEVVLIGRQGTEEIRTEEWAERLGTIGYEIVCGISRRIPRLTIGG